MCCSIPSRSRNSLSKSAKGWRKQRYRQRRLGESQQQARFIRAVAVVTRRLRTLNVNGQQVETVGIPLHWGFEGVARKGYIANT